MVASALCWFEIFFYKYKPKYFFKYYSGEPTGSASGRNYSGLKGEDKS